MQNILAFFRLSRPAPAMNPDSNGSRPTAADLGLHVVVANGPFGVEPDVPLVTATELWEAFNTNEANAERRFAHSPIYVAGAVDRVAREGAEYAVRLSVSGMAFDTVRCRTSDHRRFNLADLRRGQMVVVVGRRVFRHDGRVVVDDALVVHEDLTSLVAWGRR
jgi:hypothetical protein